MLNSVTVWTVVNIMTGAMQKIGRGLALALCLTAIAACQQTAETSPDAASPADETSTASTDTSEPPESTAQSSPEETSETNAAPAETGAANNSLQAQAPEPKPIPPLPAACTNPETQATMNECAQAEYAQADTKLNNVYQSVKAAVGDTKAEQLITAEQAWLSYRDRYCDFVQSQFAGGSMQPMVYSACLTQLTNDRIAVLEQTVGSVPNYEAADQELNALYQDLQASLGAAEQEQLTNAQLAWLDYRDAHCAFESGDTNTCLAEITTLRNQQLRSQLESRSL